MRSAHGIFLIGILLISVFSSFLLLLLPDDKEEEFIPLIKIAVGIWILQSFFSIFGHRFL